MFVLQAKKKPTMDATSLDELKEIFEGKIAGLTRCMDISSAGM